MNYPSTARFSIVKDPNRRGIDGKPSAILEIMYRAIGSNTLEEFAHIWQVAGWSDDINGKWTFNRSNVCFKYEYWPGEYYHNSIEDMLNYLEGNFHEKSANKPD